MSDVAVEFRVPVAVENHGEQMIAVIVRACEDATELFREEVRRNIETNDRSPDRQPADDVIERLQAAVLSQVEAEHDGMLEMSVSWLHPAAYWWEHDRKPGYVSPAVIVEWMLSHNIEPRDGDTVEEAAAKIARKITKKGWTGLHPFADAMETTVPLMENFLQRQLNDFARQIG